MATLAAFAFGTIGFVPRLDLFLVFAALIRLMGGFSMAVLWAVVLAILLASHPDRPAAVYAIVDTTFGLGFSFGPVLGTFLYEISGFLLPFYICGGGIFTTGMLALPLIRSLRIVEEKSLDRPSSRPLLRSPVFLTALLATSVTAFSSFGFALNLLGLHLSSLGMTTSSVGICFFSFSATYTLINILSGLVTDTYIPPWTVTVAGLFSLFLSFFLLGPSPLLPIPSGLPWKIAGLMLLGFGAGSVLTAAYSCALNEALQTPTFPEDVQTYSLVSSLWTASFAIGSFLGTSLAGPLFDNIGWDWSCTVVQGLIPMVLAFSVTAAYVVRQRNQKEGIKRKNSKSQRHVSNLQVHAQPCLTLARTKMNISQQEVENK